MRHATQTPSPRRGEGWGEGVRQSELFVAISRHQQFLPDRFENAVGIGKQVVVPEAQDAVAVFLDNRGTGGVADGVMLAAVQFDRQSGGTAGEVGNVSVDLELANELFAFEVAGTELGTELFFGGGLLGAQPARDWSQAFPSQGGSPSPNPLPHGERAQGCRLRA